MNEHDRYQPTQEDVLIGRVVDHEATPADWTRLDELAADDPELWSRLGRAQRAHAGLRIAVDDAIACAELVDIPDGRVHGAGRFSRFGRLTAGAGWAVAAVLGLVLLNPVMSNTPGNAGTGATLTAGMPTLLSQATPDEAYTQYLARGLADGRVVSEMPTLVLEQNQLEGGAGVEMLVVRRIVERRTAPTVAHLAYMPDEHGALRLTPVDPSDTPRTPNPLAPDVVPGIETDSGISF
ncbi:MAG: hypothetical protein Tsb0013_08770 [Phycisphaerales bacterium]